MRSAQTCQTKIENFLGDTSFNGFTSNDLFIKHFIKKAWGQDIAALSNMAETLKNQAASFEPTELSILFEGLVFRATHSSVNPWKKDIDQINNFGHYNYYLEHLNIVLGCYQAVCGNRYIELSTKISKHLVKASMTQKNAHARLLPHVNMRWSADQAAILYSLWLYDQNNGSSLSEKPINAWLKVMCHSGIHQETGLFVTEILGARKYSKQPRGCSLAYMIYYMSHFESEAAMDQWVRFKNHMYLSKAGLCGFREYLPSYSGAWTPDSGPIIFGVGIAASGLSLKTAAALGDHGVYQKLSRQASVTHRICELMGYIPLINKLSLIGTDLLASSILLAAQSIHERESQYV